MGNGFFPDGTDDITPKVLPEGVKLVHGDCFPLMEKMGDGEVDIILTDPPYSTQTHDGARTGTWSKKGSTPDKLLTFDSITPEQFVLFAQHAVRIAKRWVITFCDWKYAHLLEDLGLVRLGVWVKGNPAPQFTGDRPSQGWEAVAILHRDGKKRWNGGGTCATWRFNRVDAKHHPTEKPLPLLRHLLRLFSDRGELIFDPFMGSGAHGVAAMQVGRCYYGIERDERFFKVAQKRLARRR